MVGGKRRSGIPAVAGIDGRGLAESGCLYRRRSNGEHGYGDGKRTADRRSDPLCAAALGDFGELAVYGLHIYGSEHSRHAGSRGERSLVHKCDDHRRGDGQPHGDTQRAGR
jgi:hypothetical protein